MEFFPAPLENLVEQFARLPGIGSKSAQRLAFHVLNLPQDKAQAFADAILEAKRSVTLCPVCQNLTSGGLCPICASPKRDPSTICVVADPRDVAAIEESEWYILDRDTNMGYVSYSMDADHYNDPYGYFVLGSASCAGCTRATGLCLNVLGIPYEHVNENQWDHQWCRVKMDDGTYWICDAYGLYCGPEPAPYQHPYL